MAPAKPKKLSKHDILVRRVSELEDMVLTMSDRIESLSQPIILTATSQPVPAKEKEVPPRKRPMRALFVTNIGLDLEKLRRQVAHWCTLETFVAGDGSSAKHHIPASDVCIMRAQYLTHSVTLKVKHQYEGRENLLVEFNSGGSSLLTLLLDLHKSWRLSQ